MEIKRKVLVLTFVDGLGKNVNLTINEPKIGMDDMDVSMIMDEIIDSKAFGASSLVTAKSEAKFVVQQEETLSI